MSDDVVRIGDGPVCDTHGAPFISPGVCPFCADAKEQAVSDAMLRAARAVADGVDDSAFERIYLAMKAASHPLEQQQAVSGDVVERVATCCLPGGACYEAGLSWAQHKVAPLVERVKKAIGDVCLFETSSWPLRDKLSVAELDEVARAALTASGVERMREALERIANMPATGLYGSFRKPCVEIARTALQGET